MRDSRAYRARKNRCQPEAVALLFSRHSKHIAAVDDGCETRYHTEDTAMTTRNLPLNTWLIVEQRSPGTRLTLVSKHATQCEAEAERDKRNQGLPEPHFTAC